MLCNMASYLRHRKEKIFFYSYQKIQLNGFILLCNFVIFGAVFVLLCYTALSCIIQCEYCNISVLIIQHTAVGLLIIKMAPEMCNHTWNTHFCYYWLIYFLPPVAPHFKYILFHYSCFPGESKHYSIRRRQK